MKSPLQFVKRMTDALSFGKSHGKHHRLPPINGTLRVHPANPRYFTNDGGRAVYLTGSHTWSSLQDGSRPDEKHAFDYAAYLDFLTAHHHNFFRLWSWESTSGSAWHEGACRAKPMPYLRTGPGAALDGGARFDLTRLDPEYFSRLRARVKAAQDRGIYVGVMLFQGFSVAKKSARAHGNPWPGHPFHPDNNVNGIDGDRDLDGHGYEVHTLTDPRITRLQETYVRAVVDAVGIFDNVIYEISNESHGESTFWQYHMADVIRHWEVRKGKRHPIWMSFQFDETKGAGDNGALFASRAEVVSPGMNGGEDYKTDPPAADGSKIILLDTDHLWGVGGDVGWVWKTFTRGMHPLFMDPYRATRRSPWPGAGRRWAAVRQAMGLTLRLAQDMDLASMTPSDNPAHCSTRYCLRNPGTCYLAYLPDGEPLSLHLEAGNYLGEWLDPAAGIKSAIAIEAGGGCQRLDPPGRGAWVLRVRAQRNPA